MIVKLRRAGPEGAVWMLSLSHGGQPEWLESSVALDDLIASGLAWVDADFENGRWMVRRVLATPVPSGSAKPLTAPGRPRERQFKIIASA
jgi:nitrate reductase alpha subunit